MKVNIENQESVAGEEIHSNRKLHELTNEQLLNYQVTSQSRVRDVKWVEKNPTPGLKSSSSTINWGMTLLDGSSLTDPQHVERLNWAKVFVLTLLKLPAKAKRPAPGSFGTLQIEIKHLLSWMSEQAYHLPSELTPGVIQHYIDDLPGRLEIGDDDLEVGIASCNLALAALRRLWEQRHAMKKMGLDSLSAHPFGGRGANEVAKGICTKALGWIPPLPDEVAIPLFNKAAWFLGVAADDVVRLLSVFSSSSVPFGLEGDSKKKRIKEENNFLASFDFSSMDSDGIPWHAPLNGKDENSKHRLRELFDGVQAAAVITLQGASGMRVNELCGISAGVSLETGLPEGVRIEASSTGLYEWFLIRTKLAKGIEGEPRHVDWVLGMRLVGSQELPLAIRALLILNQLFEPWRAASKTNQLLLSCISGKNLPRPSTALNPGRSDKVRALMRDFIKQWVNLDTLPDESVRKVRDKDLVPWRESKGGIITTHMLRKSWANFTLACDPRLMPVIQMQFHHLSLAMTEGGYIGNNPLLLDALNSVAHQRTAQTIFESVMQRSSLAGRMGQHLDIELTKLREQVRNLPTSRRWQKTVEWVDKNELKMFFSLHATCVPIKTSQMRCHDASETPIWIRHRPNTDTREPSLCAGCANAVMDRSHEPFWTERYVGCSVSIDRAQNRTEKIPVDHRAIQFRADQSRAILQKMGVDLGPLNDRILKERDREYA